MRTPSLPPRAGRRHRRGVLRAAVLGTALATVLPAVPALAAAPAHPAVSAVPGAPAAVAEAPASAAGSARGREAHVENPYVGARGYVNPEWQALARQEPGGDRVASTPTGVWIDQVAKITGTAGAMGLRAHLDTALAQRATLLQVVLDDLPGRGCEQWATTGDFAPDELARYQREFVDPIVAIESDPKYGSLRIVNVVETSALAELIIGVHDPVCNERASSGAYVKGVQYALDKLHPASNLYTYLGIGHHGWLGWDVLFAPAAELFRQTVAGTAAGLASVDGFITNLAGYAALQEPFFTAATTVNGVQARQSTWVDWKLYVDELSFARAFRTKLVALGFDSGIGLLVDTSRNGWGGPARPTAPGTSKNINTFVDQSRIDRRISASNWCNQAGAGLGERPVAAPLSDVDAYVWMKPPGLSDGASTWAPGSGDPTLDAMCSPLFTGTGGAARPTGALADAPVRGAWFPAQFRQLLANAYPPVS